MELMTDRQRKCIDWIESVLDVCFYDIDSKEKASEFINKYIDKANAKVRPDKWKETKKEEKYNPCDGCSFMSDYDCARCEYDDEPFIM